MTSPDPPAGNGPTPATGPAAAEPPAGVVPHVVEVPSAPPAGVAPPSVLAELQRTIGTSVVGSEKVVRLLAVALTAGGHVLLEGVPGLAKTYLVRSFANCLALSFKRIQFTPDMLPSDVIGAVVIDPRTRGFEFRPGPVFGNVILADEINRASPKVQSALLEAMQERQVTVEGRSYPLPNPFIVIATENPIEQEGTYPLPEAELDRFLFRILLTYPTAEEELQILRSRSEVGDLYPDHAVVGPDEILRYQALARGVFAHADVLGYLAAMVRASRVEPRVLFGGSPRAAVQFLNAAKASALYSGRSHVVPDDVKELAFHVLNHRLVLHPEALAQQIASGRGTTEDLLRAVVTTLLDHTEVPR
ncbi:MAG: MoxR family ATPase [Thermoplasmata archaeon]|nr:MoxR family ATPase [Thermoplasmata archaeon]